MIPVDQTKVLKEGERGNCLVACLASIFELDIESVPQFEEMLPGTWRSALELWALHKHGKRVCQVLPDQFPADDFYVVVGLSYRGIRHACVGHKGIIVHDPHSGRRGIDKFEYLIIFNNVD